MEKHKQKTIRERFFWQHIFYDSERLKKYNALPFKRFLEMIPPVSLSSIKFIITNQEHPSYNFLSSNSWILFENKSTELEAVPSEVIYQNLLIASCLLQSCFLLFIRKDATPSKQAFSVCCHIKQIWLQQKSSRMQGHFGNVRCKESIWLQYIA